MPIDGGPAAPRCPGPAAVPVGRPAGEHVECAQADHGQGESALEIGDRAGGVTWDPAPVLARLAGSPVREIRLAGGGHGARHWRALLADGRAVFVKTLAGPVADGGTGWPGEPGQDGAPGGMPQAGRQGEVSARLAAEERGLRWLAEAGAVPVPRVIGRLNGLLALAWLDQASPDPGAAEAFGRDLARLHAAGAENFGAPWDGFIASLPLPNERAGSWPAWYARCRLLPYCRIAADAGTLRPSDVALVESVAGRIADLAGPGEPPSRIHGDCWSGNVLWSGGRGWLIDPAAHGGHRETDLAMLRLFGAPFLDRILGAYQEAAPLADGWRARVPLHQLHPLLVHACLFGASYREAVVAAARAALAA